LTHQSDNETPQPASVGNIGGDMVDSDDELLARVDTLVQESIDDNLIMMSQSENYERL
jgi:hypothetical protein